MKKYLLLFALGLLLVQCNKNDDEPKISPIVNENPKSVADYPSQDFMWKAMNLYYFWQAAVTDLSDTKDDDANTYAEFLATESDPEDFFYKICHNHLRVVGEEKAVDRFSGAVENYKDLVNTLQGISKSNGLEFQLYLFDDSDDIFGVVTYVAKDSNAALKNNIHRGDFFVGVNGQNLNRTNFSNLLFGSNDTYLLTMADLANEKISENGKTVELTKVENFSENPIHISKVIELAEKKVGYLMYNSFLEAYDEDLNKIFANFKSQGVNELILDFRYNGGGRVSSAVQIASSVYGAKTEDVFIRPRFNSKLQVNNGAPTNFTATTIGGTAISELNLTQVFILATGSTASASELVINGLAPYVKVVQIGSTTVGKNEFSLTMVDDVGNIKGSFLYDPQRENFINPNNQWGIQPLLGRNENANGFSDYTNGLTPDYEIFEDLGNLGVLGDSEEPFLKLALNQILGITAKADFEPIFTAELFSSSVQIKPTNTMALMDGLIKIDAPEKP